VRRREKRGEEGVSVRFIARSHVLKRSGRKKGRGKGKKKRPPKRRESLPISNLQREKKKKGEDKAATFSLDLRVQTEKKKEEKRDLPYRKCGSMRTRRKGQQEVSRTPRGGPHISSTGGKREEGEGQHRDQADPSKKDDTTIEGGKKEEGGGEIEKLPPLLLLGVTPSTKKGERGKKRGGMTKSTRGRSFSTKSGSTRKKEEEKRNSKILHPPAKPKKNPSPPLHPHLGRKEESRTNETLYPRGKKLRISCQTKGRG